MSAAEARYSLQRTLRKYQMLRFAEIMLLSLAVTLAVYGVLTLAGIRYSLWIAAASGLICFAVRSIQLNVFHVGEAFLATYINRHYPEMEESTDLLLRSDEELTLLQQLQKIRKISTFESLQQSIKLPHKLFQAGALLLTSVLLYLFVTLFHSKGTSDSSVVVITDSSAIEAQILPASISRVSISIEAPAYTGIQEKTSVGLNLKIPQYSIVKWSIAFSNNVHDPKLIFSGKDSLTLSAQNNGEYHAQRTFDHPDFYQVAWTNPDGTRKLSDYFQVEVINDQAPAVVIENLEQFIELRMTDNLKVNMTATLSDDYGLKDAYVIATVSKGSGESVKFREEKLRFTKPSVINGVNIHGTLQLDLPKLGLDPGDELYFYVEALDNKVPQSNRTRTETFFISLQDTAAVSTSVDPGLGVDLMPEYFRSQRQIIIDSEKLLKDQKKITKETFNGKSNDLAHDQKVLRLRYGEFLGEEFESGIGPQADIAPDDEGHQDEDDIMKKYGHTHDRENEHNLIEDKKSSKVESHDHHTGDSKGGEDPSKAFLHDHDNAEEETFFTQSIRSKLKAAITTMWDAELHLRLNDPQKSLPFQYKALKLLKEISQDSRIYVHRTGFDPPPLKEEKRLTGDLSEIRNSTASSERAQSISYPNIRRALAGIDLLLPNSTIVISPSLRDVFVKAGQELSVVALNQPGRHLKSLSLIKSITQNELNADEQREALLLIRSTFYNVLPKDASSPQSVQGTTHKLDQRFLDNLHTLN